MKQKLHFITLGVKDLNNMKLFYQSAFGWKVMKDSDGIVFFKLNAFILGLYPVGELASDIGVESTEKGFRGISMSINFHSENEVDEAFQDVVLKGAISVRKPERVFWGGYRGYVADVEGNFWELAYNPFLAFDHDGNVEGHS
jgi:uncharacterized protein